MSARHSFHEQYARQPLQQYERPVSGITVTLIAILAYVAYEFLLRVDVPLSSIPRILWKRSTEMSSKVFGIDAGSLLKGISRDTPLRGVSMLMKGISVDTPPGLGNWDNSCYQNSIIQGLASLHALQDFLSNVAVNGELDYETTSSALGETIDKLNDPSNHGQRLWTPAKLKSMSSWQQQDAQEYFSKLMDEIDKETSKTCSPFRPRSAPGLESFDRMGSDREQKKTRPCEALMRDAGTESIAVLRNPLEGLLAQRVGCIECGYSEGLSMIPFNCLTVPLGKNWVYDVRDCLDEYAKLEQIDGVECARCTLWRAEARLKKMADSSSSEESSATEAFRSAIRARLGAVQEALEDRDFSDATLIKKCNIPKAQWVSSTKSRQAVVARAPRSLAIHVNRSLFDEHTGAQTKNYSEVRFPEILDFGPWCLGAQRPESDALSGDDAEVWSMDPTKSMLVDNGEDSPASPFQYELRAVVTHYGRHENGHYICYRKHPYSGADKSDTNTDDVAVGLSKASPSHDSERWWRLSDEDVSGTSEDEVLRQGGVFMLFYERMTRGKDIQTDSAAASVSESKPVAVPLSEEDGSITVEEDSSPASTADAEDPPLARISQPPQTYSSQPPSVPDLGSLEGFGQQVEGARPLVPTLIPIDTPLTTVIGYDQGEQHPGQARQSATTPPSARKSLLMRTASPNSRLYNDDSLPSSTFRMVAAT